MTTPPILTLEPPTIEGLSFRPTRGEEDAETLFAVHTGRLVHDGVDLKLQKEYGRYRKDAA